MDANVSFTGNLGTDVEMKTGEGWRGARFRVAHTPRVMRQGEWVDGTTTWLSVHVYGRLADNCAASLHKGDPVMVTGRLRTRNWIGPRRRWTTIACCASRNHTMWLTATRSTTSNWSVPEVRGDPSGMSW